MMQRLMAHGVLWAMLAGIFAPLAPAPAMPHACCLRRQKHCHVPHDAGFSRRACGHECCRFLAISTALFVPVVPSLQGRVPAARMISTKRESAQPSHLPAQRLQRAPPASI